MPNLTPPPAAAPETATWPALPDCAVIGLARDPGRADGYRACVLRIARVERRCGWQRNDGLINAINPKASA